MDVDALLSKRGLKFEELEPEEQETLNSWLDALNRNQVNIPVVREYIVKMRDAVSQGLASLDDTPNNWLSILGLLIPLVGIIRKWYFDQKRLTLIARLRNYTLLEAFLSSPEKAQQAIEKAILQMNSGKSR